MHIVSLLKQGIPGNPDVCQFRQLFAPQSRSPTTAARGQAHICRLKACAARAQESGEGLSAFSLIHLSGSLSYHSQSYDNQKLVMCLVLTNTSNEQTSSQGMGDT